MIENARLYTNQGFWVLPIPIRSKRPTIRNWQKLRIALQDLPKYFNGDAQNIGVLLGLPPNYLVDIDLDSELAIKLADFFLPPTDAIFGRNGKPRSHRIYFADSLKTQKFSDPFEKNRGTATTVEIRSRGAQTIFPPSTHISGELITWDQNGTPRKIEPIELQRAVALLASACMLVRFWRKGLRHELSLAIAGALLRNGFSSNQVTILIKAICYVSADEETDDRIQTIKSTADRLLKNESVFGLPKLAELTDRRLVDQLCKWLKIETSAAASNVVTPVKPDSNNSFKLTPLDQLVGEPEEDHSYVWQDTLITGGLSICSAKPKVGKSTFARNLACAIVTGAAFLGRSTLKGKIIYLCLEEKRSEIAKQFKQMGIAGGDILVHTGPSPAAALKALEEAIQQVEPVLVIIDPLARLLRVVDYNDYGSMSRGLESFIDLARRTNVHILALHHEGKGDREGGDALLGSTALYGAVDCHIQMRKKGDHRTISSTHRYGENLPETVIELDKTTGMILEKGELHSIILDQKKSEVLEIMGVGEKLSEAQIKDRVHSNSKGIISKVLRLLLEGGLIEREGEGKKNSPYLYFRKASIDPSGENGTGKQPVIKCEGQIDSGFLGFPNNENPQNLQTPNNAKSTESHQEGNSLCARCPADIQDNGR